MLSLRLYGLGTADANQMQGGHPGRLERHALVDSSATDMLLLAARQAYDRHSHAL